MRVIVSYEKHEPDTLGYSITVKQTYVGTEEIIKVEEQCKNSIGTMLVFDTGKSDMRGGNDK